MFWVLVKIIGLVGYFFWSCFEIVMLIYVFVVCCLWLLLEVVKKEMSDGYGYG